MTSRRKLSSLSIAAFALLVVSVPSFAQAQATREESASAAMTVVEPTLALNRERVNVESVAASEEITPAAAPTVATAAKLPTLSMGMFKQSASQFAAAESQRFSASQTDIFDRVDNSKKQFRADENAGPSPRPRVTFVPSRGQKLPD